MAVATSRATVYQSIQLGKETTAGTGVTAGKRLTNMQIDPSPNIPVKTAKYPGSKVATAAQLGQEFTEFNYSGVLDFNTITYILASLFGVATPTVPGSAVLENDWAWSPPPNSPISAPATYTIEHGSSKGAEKTAFSIFSALGITWNQTTADISGKLFGQKQSRSITMTSSPTKIPSMAAPPALISTFISADGSSYTKLTSDLDGEMHFNDLWSPTFHVNDSNPSFDAIHERMGDIGGTLTVEEGSDADTFLSQLRAGTVYWLGLKALGPLIETISSVSSYHTLRINMPVYFNKTAPGDKNEVWGNTFTFEGADDGTALAAITLINKLTAL